MSQLLDQFYKEYEFLYENHDRVAGFEEAVEWFDSNRWKLAVVFHYDAFIKERGGDVITSDREAAAFAFACEVLDIG